mmetsp:Transcript_15799/g.39271  ORF Transcript_15799/g.39271 Transcript_15799/m.39271 type:complete len:441 (+) Transcript_15799:229-1551(+)
MHHNNSSAVDSSQVVSSSSSHTSSRTIKSSSPFDYRCRHHYRSVLPKRLFLFNRILLLVLVLILPSSVEAYSNSEYRRRNISNSSSGSGSDDDSRTSADSDHQEKTCSSSADTPTSNINNNSEGEQQQQQQVMRAWMCHGRNQRDLVDRLRQAGIVKTPAVQKVMEQIDRGNYISVDEYMDAPQSIGLGQTVSAPHMHAHALEEIYPSLASKLSKYHHDGSSAAGSTSSNDGSADDISKNLKILDVGCGSGYLTAAFGRWIHPRPGSSDENHGKNILGAGPGSHVFGIDVHHQLVDMARQNILKDDSDLFGDGVIDVRVGDGWKGLPEESPFDAIHVGACGDSIPYQLVDQLNVEGVMIIPIGPQNGAQILYKIERVQKTETNSNTNDNTNGNNKEKKEESRTISNKNRTSDTPSNFHPEDFRMTKLLGVRYVPLVQVRD